MIYIVHRTVIYIKLAIATVSLCSTWNGNTYAHICILRDSILWQLIASNCLMVDLLRRSSAAQQHVHSRIPCHKPFQKS